MSVIVTIRTKEQMENMDERLVSALKSLETDNREIPLAYQYLHNPNKEFIVDSDNRIGTVTNIRKSDNGDIVGAVNIISILKIASNFTGTIDNMVATLDPKANHVKIDAFIIYDKHAKDEIISKNVRRVVSPDRLARAGEIPIMSNMGADVMQEVSKTLLSEYESMMKETTQ